LITIKFKADQCFDNEVEVSSAFEVVSDKTNEVDSKTNEAVSKVNKTTNEVASRTKEAAEVEEAEEAGATTDGTTDGTNKSTEKLQSKSKLIGTKSKLLNSLLSRRM
jgi:methyl-accepting chemotaxis protein